MASTFDPLHQHESQFILMCPFCDATFNNEIIWRSHAGEHMRHHSNKNTAHKSTQTCDMEFIVTSTKVDLLNIKSEMPSDAMEYLNDFNNDIDHFINLPTFPLDVKLEPTVRPTIEEQMLNMKSANVVLDRLEETDNIQSSEKRAKRKRSKKPAVGFNFPTAPVNCALCNENISNLFPTPEEITEEFERTKQVECRLCGLIIEHLISVPLHYRRVHIDKDGKLKSMAACNACVAKKVKGQSLLFANTDPTRIQCELCSRLLRNQTSYQNHLRNFHKDRCVFMCKHCDHSFFIGRERYTKHVYTKHSPKFKQPQKQNGKEYHCHTCGKVFYLRTSMVAHLYAHFSRQRFQCTLCPAALKTAGNLKVHMYHHSGCKNVTCEVCGRRFSEKAHLASHMFSHTKEQPFPCGICGKRFSKKSNMSKHLRTHSEEKPFACDQCDKRYRDSTDLRRHKRIHGGIEKTQICTICDKRYYEAKYLRGHLKSAHNIVIATKKP